MSNPTPAPTPEDVLFREVGWPTLMNKLASYGYGPADSAAATEMLDIGLEVDRVVSAVRTALEEGRPDPVKEAMAAVTRKKPTEAEKAAAAAYEKEAADFLALPGVRDAALAVHAGKK